MLLALLLLRENSSRRPSPPRTLIVGIAVVVVLLVVLLAMQKRQKRPRHTMSVASSSDPKTWVRMPIPLQIWRTSHLDPAVIPNLFGEYAKQFTVHPPWNDAQCLEFLRQEFEPYVAQAFLDLREGAHKADLWRYAILYKRGGVYLDVKSGLYEPLMPIISALNADSRFSWLTVLNQNKSHIFNGIIATPPGNPIMLDAVHHAASTVDATNKSYYYLVNELKRLCEREYGVEGVRSAPVTLETATSRLHLLLEKCSSAECHVMGRAGGTAGDKYGTCCSAYDAGKARPVFQVRDPRYPWKA